MPSQDPVSIVENFLDISYPISPVVSEAWKTVKELAQRSDNSRYVTALEVVREYVKEVADSESSKFVDWLYQRLNPPKVADCT
jgi:hypothetical protein